MKGIAGMFRGDSMRVEVEEREAARRKHVQELEEQIRDRAERRKMELEKREALDRKLEAQVHSSRRGDGAVVGWMGSGLGLGGRDRSFSGRRQAKLIHHARLCRHHSGLRPSSSNRRSSSSGRRCRCRCSRMRSDLQASERCQRASRSLWTSLGWLAVA